MKKILVSLGVAAMAAMLVACSCTHGAKKAPKALVLYYSQGGTTEAVALEIASQTGSDIATIEPAEPYPSEYGATVQKALSDRQAGILPEVKPLAVSLDGYDIIYLGYPIWFGTCAPPMQSFLKANSLEGKKVVPFCSFGSGGLEKSIEDLGAAAPGATILEGYGVRAARKDAIHSEVTQFLRENSLVEGEYEVLPPYGESTEVSGEDATLFNEAVGDYPMLRAVAKKVCKRSTSEGTDCLFEAASLDRDGKENGTVKVIVIAPEGGEPYFKRVIR